MCVRGAQEIADVVEGIPLVSTLAQCVLLDVTASLAWGIPGVCDDVTGAAHAGCVLELVVNGVLISLEGIQRRDSHPRTEVFSALGQPVLVHGARPSRDQVHSSGPWDDPSRKSGPRCR